MRLFVMLAKGSDCIVVTLGAALAALVVLQRINGNDQAVFPRPVWCAWGMSIAAAPRVSPNANAARLVRAFMRRGIATTGL